MSGRQTLWIAALVSACLIAGGCYTAPPNRAQTGAVAGGLGGAGLGALVGSATGHPGVGALVGGATGALGGAAIGGAIDQSEANNRALIAAQLGRPVAAAPVTTGDVVAMTQAGVAENVMITHIQTHGMAGPLSSQDLITLNQFKVSPRVVQVMQAPVVPVAQPIYVRPYAPPVVMAPAAVVTPAGYYGAWRPAGSQPTVAAPPAAFPPPAAGAPAAATSSAASTPPALIPTPPTPQPPPQSASSQ
jgi:hypothetical protein